MRLKKPVVKQALDYAIIKEIAEGKWYARSANERPLCIWKISSRCSSTEPYRSLAQPRSPQRYVCRQIGKDTLQQLIETRSSAASGASRLFQGLGFQQLRRPNSRIPCYKYLQEIFI
jgi:hypothetical protein